jgi:hypothetical protein
MSYLEMISLDETGVTVTPIDEISIGDEIEILFALPQATLACVVCLAPVQSGLGHSFCPRHLKKGK